MVDDRLGFPGGIVWGAAAPRRAAGRGGAVQAKYLTCWLPFTDACPENSCLYLIPRSADPAYLAGDPDREVCGRTASAVFPRAHIFPVALFAHRLFGTVYLGPAAAVDVMKCVPFGVGRPATARVDVTMCVPRHRPRVVRTRTRIRWPRHLLQPPARSGPPIQSPAPEAPPDGRDSRSGSPWLLQWVSPDRYGASIVVVTTGAAAAAAVAFSSKTSVHCLSWQAGRCFSHTA